jgi:hypothetical protein
VPSRANEISATTNFLEGLIVRAIRLYTGQGQGQGQGQQQPYPSCGRDCDGCESETQKRNCLAHRPGTPVTSGPTAATATTLLTTAPPTARAALVVSNDEEDEDDEMEVPRTTRKRKSVSPTRWRSYVDNTEYKKFHHTHFKPDILYGTGEIDA